MLERARSLGCRRSTSLRRVLTWLERVPAAKRAMKSLSWEIFFSRCAFCGFHLERIWVFGHHHLVVAAGVGDDGLVVDVGNVGADAVEEVAVVGDDDERAIVAHQEILQPVDGVEIEVVGGLVQEQGLGVAKEGLGQQHANLLPALQLAHVALVERLGQVQAVQQHGGVALGGVAVLVAYDAFELAQAHAVFVGQLGLLVDAVALFHGGPQGLLPMMTVSMTR